jgi:ParB-like nuclease family protein
MRIVALVCGAAPASALGKIALPCVAHYASQQSGAGNTYCTGRTRSVFGRDGNRRVSREIVLIKNVAIRVQLCFNALKMATFPQYRVEQVDTLIPAVLNARTHTDEQIEQIVASIKEFGFTNPILVDKERGVVAGHGRLLAARRLGMTQVPVVELSHLTPQQLRAYMLADNKLALLAGWDDDILRGEINALKDAGFDVDLTGFDSAEIDQLFAPEADPNSLWSGMPEFNQPNAFAFRSIIVHFVDRDGVEEFKKVIDQPEITEVTKFIWFPPQPEESFLHRSYVTEGAEQQGDGEGIAPEQQPQRDPEAQRVRHYKRVVQLLFPVETLPPFMEKVLALTKEFGTTDITETVAKAIDLAYETPHAEQRVEG